MFYLIRTSDIGEVAYKTAGGWIGVNLSRFFSDEDVIAWRPLPARTKDELRWRSSAEFTAPAPLPMPRAVA